MALDGYPPHSHIPILVEYHPYPGLSTTEWVRTDVAVGEAFDKNTTLCDIAIEYCREEGMLVTGKAKVTDRGIFAPKE